MTGSKRAAFAAAAALVAVVTAQSAAGQEAPAQLGALSPENLAKPRPAAPFDLTGTWQHELRGPQSWKFVPPTFELTPEAQRHYDAGRAAAAENKVYRDDIGQCWPAGMPLIMTRVHPFVLLQQPTVIYYISGFINSVRIIYLDGRGHSDAEIVVPSFNGESIGRWEGDALVVETKYFPGHHHWLDQGGASIPASDALHIVERQPSRARWPAGFISMPQLATLPSASVTSRRIHACGLPQRNSVTTPVSDTWRVWSKTIGE